VKGWLPVGQPPFWGWLRATCRSGTWPSPVARGGTRRPPKTTRVGPKATPSPWEWHATTPSLWVARGWPPPSLVVAFGPSLDAFGGRHAPPPDVVGGGAQLPSGVRGGRAPPPALRATPSFLWGWLPNRQPLLHYCLLFFFIKLFIHIFNIFLFFYCNGHVSNS
jgi:hypothetical protein